MSENEKEKKDYEIENYELEQCRTCEKQFVVDPKNTRKICLVCWKIEKKYKLSVADKQIIWLQRAINDERTAVQLNKGGISKTAHQLLNAEERLAIKENEIANLKSEIEHLHNVVDHTKKIMHKNTNWLLTTKRIKTLLKFVHPDKQNGEKEKAVANGITTWLLSYLEKRKEIEQKCKDRQMSNGNLKSKYPKWHSKYGTDI